MRYVFRGLCLMLACLCVWNLATAQRALDELPPGTEDQLRKPGTDESHQGADNPRQGSRSERPGPFGGPDPYGPEGAGAILDKAEIQSHDPQWQLKLDMHEPKRIVVQRPDGTAKEYWYVMFRVINDNTRDVRQTQRPARHTGAANPERPADPLEDTVNTGFEREGVPVNAHLDFELHVFTRDLERDPWDTEWPDEPEEEGLSPLALAQRRANMKQVFQPVSDHFVLQRVAEAEGMYEWMDNRDYINEPVMLLHPLSDFQRQAGFAHDNTAFDFSGPRCVGYRFVLADSAFDDVADEPAEAPAGNDEDNGGENDENAAEEPVEEPAEEANRNPGGMIVATRFVAVYNDNTFAGFYGQGDTLPDGARLVDNPQDPMWGKLSIRRYQAGDTIDRYGRPLRANAPGHLNARIAGGHDGDAASYGAIAADHPAVGQPVRVPHARRYRAEDRVLVDYNTGVAHAEMRNRTYRISGKVVSRGDERWSDAVELGSQAELREHVGRPVKMLDSRGRAIVRYVVTYQPGDVLTQAEWDIYQERIGESLLARYSNIENIVGRPLTADDPVVGMPKIRMGHLTGERGLVGERIERGIDTGRRGPNGEVILEAEEGFETGRAYAASRIDPEHFRRDLDGVFTTNREAPLPANHGLRDGEEYIYAPLGNARDGAMPVPQFDRYGAWEDYRDPISNQRIPLRDENGELVRDMMDQILYLKEFEYEYMYMYEFERLNEDDDGFRSRRGGDAYRLVREEVEFTVTRQTVEDASGESREVTTTLPLTRLVVEDRQVTSPIVVDGYQYRGENGEIEFLTRDEYTERTGNEPGEGVATVKIVRSEVTTEEVVVGVYSEGRQLAEGQRAESLEEARARAEADPNTTIERRQVMRFVNRYRADYLGADLGAPLGEGQGPRQDELERSAEEETDVDFEQTYKTWSRWTVPPPLVYQEGNEWRTITRLATQIGPARRWDGADAPRFLTRNVSEMWGVAIFENVSRDWDWANVYVRGLRGHVANAGLTPDQSETSLPSPADPQGRVDRAYFKPRRVSQEWVYRVRYERLGDEFEPQSNLIRRLRSFWYLDSSDEYAEQELPN